MIYSISVYDKVGIRSKKACAKIKKTSPNPMTKGIEFFNSCGLSKRNNIPIKL